MRVGFVIRGSGNGWMGGTNYIHNLFAAIRTLPNAAVEPVIFTGQGRDQTLAASLHVETVQIRALDLWTPQWLVRKSMVVLGLGDRLLHDALQHHRISVLSHYTTLGVRPQLPTVGWIADFQHLHLPQFFSEKERKRRDKRFMHLCGTCQKIIVSSHCARLDLASFAPKHAYKAEVLRFVAAPRLFDDVPTLSELQHRYGFGNPYFILPNQFWVHKNHLAVITALRILKAQRREVLIISTGYTGDHRHPDHFAGLMKYAEECDVLNSFRVLGVVPPRDLGGLMRHALAFINPSRFEGWSTTVEESKSLGKPVVLSDIPVHREQDPELGAYFNPDNPEELAEILWRIWTNPSPQLVASAQQLALAKTLYRQQEFARTFEVILQNTTALGHNPPAGDPPSPRPLS